MGKCGGPPPAVQAMGTGFCAVHGVFLAFNCPWKKPPLAFPAFFQGADEGKAAVFLGGTRRIVRRQASCRACQPAPPDGDSSAAGRSATTPGNGSIGGSSWRLGSPKAARNRRVVT